MSALVRCPRCDTFVKPPSISAGACPFCPQARQLRNPIPGIVLAATIAAVPACSSTSEPEAVPVYGIAVEDPDVPKTETPAKQTDAAVPIKAEPPEEVDIYGLAPDTE